MPVTATSPVRAKGGFPFIDWWLVKAHVKPNTDQNNLHRVLLHSYARPSEPRFVVVVIVVSIRNENDASAAFLLGRCPVGTC